MKTKFDPTTGKREWILDKWYQKTSYVIGIIYVILFILGFIIGFFSVL